LKLLFESVLNVSLKAKFELDIALFNLKQCNLPANSFSMAFLFLKKKKQKNFFI
jgi:hypothetical protein